CFYQLHQLVIMAPWIKNSISTKLKAGSVHKNHNYYVGNVLELYHHLETIIVRHAGYNRNVRGLSFEVKKRTFWISTVMVMKDNVTNSMDIDINIVSSHLSNNNIIRTVHYYL
uniref:hypothetical protein n=3 Tax=Vibrio parahaemolyticus TaxID=670 RepID=UPI001E6414E2